MPLLLSSMVPFSHFTQSSTKPCLCNPKPTSSHSKSNKFPKNLFFPNKKTLHSFNFRVAPEKCVNSTINEESRVEFENEWKEEEADEEEEEDVLESLPWEGAILYQRNPSVSHLEYCTTLERLGLGKLSTDVSKSRAAVMGLRVTKSVKDFPLGTPVLIAVDVTRKKQKLRLDGIIRTVITLGCNRCGEPAAECVFSNFSLVLTEEPIEEPDVINMGVIFGEDKSRGEEEDDDASIDLDDWLHFPPEEKVIDISKHIRDMVHLEIKISAICDPTCKGLCLKCGSNLNTSSCNCSKQKVKEKGYGPLAGLKEQMQK